MSIYGNVIAGLRPGKAKGLSTSDLEGIAEKSLRSANLWEVVKDRLNRPGASLSGGQQQRLCIARAIAIEDLTNELRSLFTIVIVTHNMQQAGRVSDHTAFVNLAGVGQPGHLIETGITEEFFAHPQNPRTRDYVMGRFG